MVGNSNGLRESFEGREWKAEEGEREEENGG